MKIEASTQAFNARHIAKAKVKHLGKQVAYDVFELTQKDFPLLPKLRQSIDLKKIEPSLNDYETSLWQSILSMVLLPPNPERIKTLLLVKGNKACGAMKYTNNKNSYHINGRTTWGKKDRMKLPFAGKVLSFTLFNLLLKENKNKIESQIIKVNRFFGISKAEQIGFKSVGGDEVIENMRATKSNVQKTLDKFKDLVEIKLLENNEDIDLNEIIKI